MTAFDDAIDTLFGDANLGVAATYTPPSGPIISGIRVIHARQDRELQTFGQPFMRGDVIEVRASDVANPQKDGVFTIAGETFTIASDPMMDDPDRLVWKCTVV